MVNGSPLSMAGVSVPFSETRATTMDVALQDLEIATYLRLSPVALGFTVPAGRLSTDLKIRFEQQAGVNQLAITGTSQVDDLQIDCAGRLAARIRASACLSDLDRVEPIAGRYGFGDLDVEGLDVAIDRAAGYQISPGAGVCRPAEERTGKRTRGRFR